MIEEKQIRVRASKLYYDINRRGAKAKIPVQTPYSSEAFATWLLATIGCNAFLCPYCNAPLDALSMTLDHGLPLARGGDNKFSNLVPCCEDCNKLKHKLTGDEYLALREKLRELPPHVEANVLGRLRTGGLGQKMMWQKAANKKPSLLKSDEPF